MRALFLDKSQRFCLLSKIYPKIKKISFNVYKHLITTIAYKVINKRKWESKSPKQVSPIMDEKIKKESSPSPGGPRRKGGFGFGIALSFALLGYFLDYARRVSASKKEKPGQALSKVSSEAWPAPIFSPPGQMYAFF
ncbi:MAG: hypothetical protein HC913_11605 [Microscillaceae bacterium]|nr:hypothetical protein [Microscillaceae bacterium]